MCLPAAAAEMTVSAAASLTNAFTELKGLFEKQQADLTVHTNFAASNPILKQIQEGAPARMRATSGVKSLSLETRQKPSKVPL